MVPTGSDCINPFGTLKQDESKIPCLWVQARLSRTSFRGSSLVADQVGLIYDLVHGELKRIVFKKFSLVG